MKKINSLFKRLTLLLVSSSLTLFAFGQTSISTEAELRAIANDLSGSYKLTADIVLTSDWTPIGEFTGTLDGNGKTISGLKVEDSGTAERGLFSKTKGATIKNLGIDNAYVNGNERTGIIIGLQDGGLIEGCYVINSYVEGRDHVGTIVGHLSNGGKITNSYSTSHIYSREHQAGGLVGMINDNNTEISNCYFSGIVRCGSGSRPAGIVASRDRGNPIVKNCVNMAPYILGNGNLRLTGDKSEIQKSNLYSLSTTLLGGSANNFSGNPITNFSDSNYGANKGHGANIPGGDENAKNQAFYTDGEGIDDFDGLNWDFENTWKLLSDGYPVLKWQTSPAVAVIPRVKQLSLKEGNSLNLSEIFSGQALTLSFSTESSKVEINENVLTAKTTITAAEEIFITVATEGTAFQATKIKVVLLPDNDTYVLVSTPDELKYMNLNPEGKFKLTQDITISVWSPLDEFKGTFDGDGHIISGMRYYRTNNNSSGFFSKTKGATIKNLGVEGANVVAQNQVGVIIGDMSGGLMEACYVANSYVEGNDHVASLAGRAKDSAIIQNCYASAIVKTRANQSGGLVGVTENSKISKSYFAGTVTANSSRANGIVGLVDKNDNSAMIVENCVALAPVLTANNTSNLFRIIDTGSKGATLTDNYALATMLIGKSGEQAVRSSEDASSKDGKDVAFASAKTVEFYQTTLGWDFTTTWKMMSDGYPVLKWQESPINTTIIDLKDAYSLKAGESIDFSSLNSSHGLTFTFTTESSQINIENSVVTPNGGIFPPETAIVNVSVSDGFNLLNKTIEIQLFPAGVVEISNVEDFMLIAQYPDMDYILTADIDLTGKEFNGIGSSNKPFTGNFDGNGHIVKGLKSVITTDEIGAGLFRVTNNATIKRLGVEDAYVVMSSDKKSSGIIIGEMNGGTLEESYTANSYVEGYDHAGGLVGSVYGGTLKNCFSTAEVYSRAHQAGGVAGAMKGGSTIENCYFSGLVSNKVRRSIGLGGYHDEGTGAVTISNSVTLAPFIFSGDNMEMYRIFDNNGSREMVLTNNYALSTTQMGRMNLNDLRVVSEEDENYGADKRHGANLTPAESKTQTFYEETLTWDFEEVWAMTEGAYPVLKWQTERSDKITNIIYTVKEEYSLNEGETITLDEYVFSSNGLKLTFSTTNTNVSIVGNELSLSGNVVPFETATILTTVAGNDNFQAASGDELTVTMFPALFEIATAEDLLIVGQNPAGNYKLIADISLTEEWVPVSNFTGEFDGNYFTISGLKHTAADRDNVGLFGKTEGAVIKRLGLKDVNINVSNQKNRVGAIIGTMNGGLLEECFVTGSVIGREDVGALVGMAEGDAIIRKSYSTANVNAKDQEGGGLLGNLKNAKIEDCYYAGSLVESWRNVSGIVGRADADGGAVNRVINLCPEIKTNDGNDSRRIINVKGKTVTLSDNYSLSTTTVKGKVISTEDENYGMDKMHGENIPEGDENAKKQAFYEDLNWDFDNDNWYIDEGYSYPKLYKFLNDDATLKSLSLVEGTLSPAFSTEVTEYSISLDSEVTTVTVEAETNNNAARYEVEGNDNIQVGENTITVRVIAENGTKKEYVITATRAASSDAGLASLSLNEGALSPIFSTDVTAYTVSVGNDVTSLTVTAEARHEAATVSVTGGENLLVGENTVKVNVTAEDGTTTKEYVITVTRAASSDAGLASLSVSEGTLSPVFSTDVTEYTMSVVYDVVSISVVTETSHKAATVSITGDKGLVVGANTVKVTVTAEDGTTTKEYVITVTREKGESIEDLLNDSLKIKVNDRTLSLEFDGEAMIRLYSISGNMIHQDEFVNNYDYTLNNAGVYILVVNNTSYKVIVK